VFCGGTTNHRNPQLHDAMQSLVKAYIFQEGESWKPVAESVRSGWIRKQSSKSSFNGYGCAKLAGANRWKTDIPGACNVRPVVGKQQ